MEIESICGLVVDKRLPDLDNLPGDDVEAILLLDGAIKMLETLAKVAREKRQAVADRMAEEWGALGKQSENRNGRTIYKSRDLYCGAKKGMSESLVDAMQSEGLGDLVKDTIHPSTLKSWVRENSPVDESGERDYSQIPESIRSMLNIYESFSIRVRNS